VPINHVRSGPSARCAEDRRKAYHLALRSATKPIGRDCRQRLQGGRFHANIGRIITI
jgi:hypothetical protein